MIVFVRYEQDNNQKFCISYKYTDSVPKTPVFHCVFAQNMPINAYNAWFRQTHWQCVAITEKI